MSETKGAISKGAAKSMRVNRRVVKAIIIDGRQKDTPRLGHPDDDPDGEEAGKSKVLPEDPWVELTREGRVIEPPFSPLELALLPENSAELNQCIEAMEINIEGFGYRFVSRVDLDNPEMSDEMKADIKVERTRLTNLFAYICLELSFTGFRRRLRRDEEGTGNCYFEVIRNAAGKVQQFVHIPSYQMRLGLQDKDAVEVEMPILELQADGSVQVKRIKVWKRFRRYAQQRITVSASRMAWVGTQGVRWFKEFGDKRIMDCDTGEYAEPGQAIPEAKRANEVVHFKLYSSRTPYGLPRFIGNLLSIYGDRAAEEINYITFKNNNIPSMVFMVSNGQLTQGTIDRIESFVESQIQGNSNYSKFLIVEGEPWEGEEGEDQGQVKIEMKPLAEVQHKDALFQKYSGNNRDQIRRSFRLPPIFVGRSDDYTRATAETSRRLADEQVFAPERDEFDDWVNRILFPEMGIRYHRFKTNSPNTTDNTELVKILSGSEKTGGMTPRIARMLLEDILGIELPSFPKDFDADVPFSLTMAEAVKNKADPSEPGQQVTALKRIATLTGSDDWNEERTADLFLATCAACGHDNLVSKAEAASEDDTIAALLKMRTALEKRWRQDAYTDDPTEEEDPR